MRLISSLLIAQCAMADFLNCECDFHLKIKVDNKSPREYVFTKKASSYRKSSCKEICNIEKETYEAISGEVKQKWLKEVISPDTGNKLELEGIAFSDADARQIKRLF